MIPCAYNIVVHQLGTMDLLHIRNSIIPIPITLIPESFLLLPLENHITGRIAYISQMAIRPVPDK